MPELPEVKRIMVIANKSWEADPLVSVCLNPKLRSPIFDICTPGESGFFSSPGKGSRPIGAAVTPRCVCKTSSAVTEIWCIEDWMGDANHSSSKVKIESVLPRVWKFGRQPDFVVAFGTAGFPDLTTANGCVVIGSSTYLFNPYRDEVAGVNHDTTSDWDDRERVGRVLTSRVGAKVVGQFASNPDLRLPIDSRLIPAPVNPAIPPVLLAASNFVAISDINIVNYDDYAWADARALEICRHENPASPVGSIETTHGLIRLMSDAPFVFVSGITDRLGYFAQDLGPRTVGQNFLAAHNAAVALCWLLPLILSDLSMQRLDNMAP